MEIEEALRNTAGPGAQERQRQLLALLFDRGIQADHLEWVEKILASALSMGASTKTFARALQAFIDEHPGLAAPCGALLSSLTAFSHDALHSRPFLPIRPQLAAALSSSAELCRQLAKRGATEVFVEPKLDGERLQIHFDSGASRLMLYARSLLSANRRFGFLAQPLTAALVRAGVREAVLDCEVVGWDHAAALPAPFSALQSLPDDCADPAFLSRFKVFVFDALFLDGQNLLDQPQMIRRQALAEALGSAPDAVLGLMPSAREDVQGLERALAAHYAAAIAAGHEGLLVKEGDGPYSPDSRRNWFKLKGLGKGAQDNVDLVLLGGFYGRGRRERMISSFLLGARLAGGGFAPLTCVGSGFTNDQIEALNKQLRDYVSEGPAGPALQADVLFRPHFVWEVACDSFSLSSYYGCGAGSVHPRKGLSLRFPVFVRPRADKTPAEATSEAQLLEMFRAARAPPPGDRP